jgi:hypothetical protein
MGGMINLNVVRLPLDPFSLSLSKGCLSSIVVCFALQGLRFSPVGELLSFASPKESNQRKGDPTSLPCGFPIWRARSGASPTRPGTGHKTPRAAELGHGSALTPPAHAKSAALKGESCWLPYFLQMHACAQASAGVPLVCRREAQPPEGKRGWVSELRSEPRFVRLARASSSPASGGEHRRGAEGRHSRGGFLFGYFFLATQEKVTRPQAKREAIAGIRKPNLSEGP